MPLPSIINILESVIKINMEFKRDIAVFVGLGPVFIEPGSKKIELKLQFNWDFISWVSVVNVYLNIEMIIFIISS